MARTAYKVCAKCNLKVAMTDSFCRECGSQKFNVMDKPEKDPLPPTPPTPPTPNPNPIPIWKEEETMENKKSYRWLWILLAILAILAVILVVQLVTANQQEKANLTVRLAQLEASVANVEQQKASQQQVAQTGFIEVQPQTNYTPKPNNQIIVYRGATDQETINYNNAWPGYFSYEQFSWFDNRGFSNIHLKGGTYVMPCNGIISGDVKVNGKKIHDDNDHTFLVIDVKQGDQVYVDPAYQARFTTELTKEEVVLSVQTQYPTWTRQPSRLN